ncbi:tyrosine-type recombinase/integrase [Curtobacterium sp. MCSS17_015]|uniref:tyrosine-type recombinase/integrase n=1 Tax=Curtobacterium sp. MCSS17_015 TaxID=2175666 RepID=UPI000DA8E670|nr:tyrosine-type recombinase/integrase [Curtobacterium sp. MCSS17_015]WIB27877.1 tyrosine-type recombinase/integrase [Curtobacterium sp. MCSS17_015]
MARPKARKTRESWGQLDRLPSGRFRARYVGPDGERHAAPTTFDNMTDARGWLAQQRSRVVAGDWRPPRAALQAHESLEAYARAWISTRTGRDGAPLRERTRVEYERLLAGPLEPLLAAPVAQVTPVMVRTWYAGLTASGKLTQAARAYGLLRAILQTATSDGILTANPAQVRGAQNATTGRKVEPPTLEELRTIVKHMPDHLRLAVLIAAWGGLRYGELTELRRSDVTLTDSTVLVSVSRAVVHTAGRFRVGLPKSAAGVRVVALPPTARSAVIGHLNDRVGPDAGALLFPSRSGTHLAQSTFARSWYPAREAAGRSDMPWHALRHFAGTRYAQTGATLREIQARLGHSTVAAAMRYQAVTGRDAELAARMADE